MESEIMFKEINAKEIKGNLIEAIANEWMLITAGDQNGYNMMTASWGFAKTDVQQHSNAIKIVKIFFIVIIF